MSVDEFSREFDILYNNIMSNTAPGIDEYEKSVFLTKAQEFIVTAIYDGSFEGSEKFRENLNYLVTTKIYDSTSDSLKNTTSNLMGITNPRFLSKYFSLPSDCLFIVYEHLKLNAIDTCKGAYQTLTVVPTTHDQAYRFLDNPFKRPNNKKALRLNNYPSLSNGSPSEINNIEIVTSKNVTNYDYFIRYVRRPQPIVLYNDPQLTVDGVGTPTTCQLDPSLHRAILDAAVKLAADTYKKYS